MCEYCDKRKNIKINPSPLHEEDQPDSAVIMDGGMVLFKNHLAFGNMDFDYCPMCGRKLKEVNNKMKINEILKEDNIGKYYKSTLGDNIVYQVVRYGGDLNLHSEKYGYIDDTYCVYAIINAEFQEKKIIKIESELDKFMYKYIKAYKGVTRTRIEQSELFDECGTYLTNKYGYAIWGNDVEIEMID